MNTKKKVPAVANSKELVSERINIILTWNEHVETARAASDATDKLLRTLKEYNDGRERLFFERLKKRKMSYCDIGQHYVRENVRIVFEDRRRIGTSDHYYDYDHIYHSLHRACDQHFEKLATSVYGSEHSSHLFIRLVKENKGELMLKQGESYSPLPSGTKPLPPMPVDEALAAKFGLPPKIEWVTDFRAPKNGLVAGDAAFTGVIDKPMI